MSLAGRPSELNGNNNPVGIPPDIVWDSENPPVAFACSQHTEHHPKCDGTCESMVLDESMVRGMNIAREYARNGMSFKGVVEGYDGMIPHSGMRVELFDLECEVKLLKQLLMELTGLSLEEYDVQFRELRSDVMEGVLEATLPGLKRARAEQALGIVPKKILGPDGSPL
jgi:hypothetical protein